jgi:hypothetical protein
MNLVSLKKTTPIQMGRSLCKEANALAQTQEPGFERALPVKSTSRAKNKFKCKSPLPHSATRASCLQATSEHINQHKPATRHKTSERFPNKMVLNIPCKSRQTRLLSFIFSIETNGVKTQEPSAKEEYAGACSCPKRNRGVGSCAGGPFSVSLPC